MSTMLLACDNLAVFDTAPYEETVLQLQPGLSERFLDEQCHDLANKEGILPHRQTNQFPHLSGLGARDSLLSVAPSASTTRSTASLRSQSIDSRNSYSTDLTSNFSRASTDRRSSRLFSLPLRSLSRLSSLDTDGRDLKSPSAAQSQISFSSSLGSNLSSSRFPPSQSSSRRAFSVRRGLGRLSMFRRTSQGSDDSSSAPRSAICHECNNNSTSAEPALHLDCGHALCHEHFLRLAAAVEARPCDSPPTCCGRRIPYPNSQAALRSHRQRRGSVNFDNYSVHANRITSPPSDTGAHISFRDDIPRWHHPFERGPAKLSLISQSISDEAYKNLAEATAFPDFQSLRQTQSNTIERFFKFRAEQIAKLSDFYASIRRERVSQHEQRVEALRDTHAQALSRLEEQQLTAEIDLREVHEQEKSNCSLALRHMEGYVESHDPLGSGRTVTEQDKRELEKQYWLRDHLDQRHDSAINVLREQQARQMRIRAQNQEKELASMALSHQRSLAELDRAFRAETQELDELFMRRKERLVLRWSLADEMWRRQHNEKDPSKIGFPIAPFDWPLPNDLGI